MTATEAAAATGLIARKLTSTEPRWAFLRCQLGAIVKVKRDLGDAHYNYLGDKVPTLVDVEMFKLIGFGETFEDAVLHLPAFKHLKKLTGNVEVEL